MDMFGLTDKATLLVVDDAPDNLNMMRMLLKDDYQVKVANCGEKALEIAFSANPPDLILLDITMPGMDGYEVCRRLQGDPLTRRIPVIFTTVKHEIEDEEIGLDLGAVDYIVKPYRIPIIGARVRTHLRLKRQADLLESLAKIDGLTHIPNRRAFDEALDLEWRRSCRVKSPLSVLMVDVDFFKDYNDAYGHGKGDTCLVQIAETLAAVISRPGDLAARYGGEEFAAVLPNTGAEGAYHLAERLCLALKSLAIPHAHSSAAEHVTVSVGFSTACCSDELTPEDLLRCADLSLYRAKEGGRNRVEGGAAVVAGRSSSAETGLS